MSRFGVIGLFFLSLAVGCGVDSSGATSATGGKRDDSADKESSFIGMYVEEASGTYLRFSADGSFERNFEVGDFTVDEDRLYLSIGDDTDAFVFEIGDVEGTFGARARLVLSQANSDRITVFTRRALYGERCGEGLPCEGNLSCVDTCEAL